MKLEEEGQRHKHLEVEGPHRDVYVAIRDAFKAMQRQFQDYVQLSVARMQARPHSSVFLCGLPNGSPDREVS